MWDPFPVHHGSAVPNVVLWWEREHENHKCKLIKFHAGVFAELSNITAVRRHPLRWRAHCCLCDALQLLYSLEEAAVAPCPLALTLSPPVHTPACTKYEINGPKIWRIIFRKCLVSGSESLCILGNVGNHQQKRQTVRQKASEDEHLSRHFWPPLCDSRLASTFPTFT